MTPEQKQRIEQILERQPGRRRRSTMALDPQLEKAVLGDIDFLLSLVKSQEAPPALLVQPQIIRSDADVRQLFDAWWRVNHPFSWWAEERGGQPLPEPDRQMVRDLSERAFYAAEVLSLNAATSMRSACVEKVKAFATEKWNKQYEAQGQASALLRAEADAANEIAALLESISIEKQSRSL